MAFLKIRLSEKIKSIPYHKEKLFAGRTRDRPLYRKRIKVCPCNKKANSIKKERKFFRPLLSNKILFVPKIQRQKHPQFFTVIFSAVMFSK